MLSFPVISRDREKKLQVIHSDAEIKINRKHAQKQSTIPIPSFLGISKKQKTKPNHGHIISRFSN